MIVQLEPLTGVQEAYFCRAGESVQGCGGFYCRLKWSEVNAVVVRMGSDNFRYFSRTVMHSRRYLSGAVAA